MRVNIFRRFLGWYRRFQISRSPQLNLVWGFFLYTLVGWALLSLPFLHTQPVGWLDNLFISTSAISTTGLVTVSVADSYTLVGEIIVAVLFQVGGIGYMTLTTYYLLFTTRTITRWHNKIIGAAFTMPDTIKVGDFIRSAILFTVVMEVLGTLAFFWAFTAAGMATGQAVWYSIFHSISAFCTAGFGLFNDSFEGYADNVAVNTIVSVLAIAGSLGFIVITDLWYRLSGKTESVSFTTKIVIYGFLILLSLGTVLLYATEPLVHAGGEGALMKSFFGAMTAMTTVGFNTIPTGGLRVPLLLLVVFLMYIGASPSGTAGGMKITTLTAMISVLKSRLFGEKRVTFFNRRIPYERLFVATSTFILYTSLIFVFSLLLSYSESASYERILFEVASALGTVGLSTGITGDLSAVGKLLIITLMFIGRVGVLTFGFALLERRRDSDAPEDRHIEDDLAV